jgi:hypothetical protein
MKSHALLLHGICKVVVDLVISGVEENLAISKRP